MDGIATRNSLGAEGRTERGRPHAADPQPTVAQFLQPRAGRKAVRSEGGGREVRVAVPESEREAKCASGIDVDVGEPGSSKESEELLCVRRLVDRALDDRRPEDDPGGAHRGEEGGSPLAESHDLAKALTEEVGRCSLEHLTGDRVGQAQVASGSMNDPGGQDRRRLVAAAGQDAGQPVPQRGKQVGSE